jgi:hypothetical protein
LYLRSGSVTCLGEEVPLGVIGLASIDLKFYGIGDESPLDDVPQQYNIYGSFLLQEIRFRLCDSDLFADGRYQYLGKSIDFDSPASDETVDMTFRD